MLCLLPDVFPSPFEGAKLLVNKGLSNHFQISHTLTMSTLQPSGYKFGCTYVGTKQYSPSEVSRLFGNAPLVGYISFCVSEIRPISKNRNWP